jgi:hypothetical protein
MVKGRGKLQKGFYNSRAQGDNQTHSFNLLEPIIQGELILAKFTAKVY